MISGYSRRELSTFPAGVTLMLYDAIHRVRENPPVDWSEAVFRLIGRQDYLSEQLSRTVNFAYS